MDIIDDIFGSVQKAGKLVADKAIDTKDFIKLEYRISGVRNEIGSKLKALGKITYMAEMGKPYDDELKQKYIGEIRELATELASLNEQMAKYKKVCAECGKSFMGNSEYCTKCGTKL